MATNDQQIHEFGPFRYYEGADGVVLRYTPRAAAADGAAPIEVCFMHDGAVYVENSTSRAARLDRNGSLALYVGDEDGTYGAMCAASDSVIMVRPDRSYIVVEPDNTVVRFTSDGVSEGMLNGYEDGEQA